MFLNPITPDIFPSFDRLVKIIVSLDLFFKFPVLHWTLEFIIKLHKQYDRLSKSQQT